MKPIYVNQNSAKIPVISDDPVIQERYVNLCLDGVSHRLAEVLAFKKFPGVKGSNASFMTGTHHQDTAVDHYRYQAAIEQGVDTNGKRYISGLARYPNDPEAWVSGISDVVRIVTDRGWNCNGAVDHQGFDHTQVPRPEEVAIAPDIVQDHVEDRLSAYPEGDRTETLRRDIEEYVTQELTGQLNYDTGPKVSDYDDPFTLPGMED